MKTLLRMAALAGILIVTAAGQDTPPTLTDFTWSNQGTHLAAQASDGNMVIAHPGAAGLGFNWGVLLKPLPAAPYTIVAGFTGHINGKSASLAACLYDSTTGKFIAFSAPASSDNGTVSISAWKMTNFTTYAGAYLPPGILTGSTLTTNPLMVGGLKPRYIRLKDDGTYRSFAVSQFRTTGFYPLHVALNNDFISPTHYGYCLRGTGDSQASQMTVFHESIN